MPADNNNSADEGESLQRLHDTIFSVRNSHDVAGPSSSSREIEQNEVFFKSLYCFYPFCFVAEN